MSFKVKPDDVHGRDERGRMRMRIVMLVHNWRVNES